MGAYGVFLFLLPPLSRTWLVVIPWLVGGLFTAQLVLNPFVASFRPGEYARRGPLRWLPVELTLVNNMPVDTDTSRVRIWFGDNPDLTGSRLPDLLPGRQRVRPGGGQELLGQG